MRRFASGRLWGFPPFLSLVAALRGFLTRERLSGYDIIHIGMAYPYATAVRHALGKRPALPAIVTITGGDILTDDESGYGYGQSRSARAAIRRTLRWAALVQANSPRSKDAVIAYGCPAERVAIQPPQSPHEPVPLERLPSLRAEARRALETTGAIPPGRLLVGLGRMEPIKAYDDVIRALPAILRVVPETTALFAGPTRTASATAYRASLDRLARDLGVAEHVRILPQVPYKNVPQYFAAADIALIPSLLDGLNKTGLEAAAVGTPSVVSEAAGLAYYVRQYASGMVVPPRDPPALANAIISLLSDADAWQRASVGAQAMAEGFSLARTAAGVLRLYERVLGT